MKSFLGFSVKDSEDARGRARGGVFTGTVTCFRLSKAHITQTNLKLKAVIVIM